MDLLLLSNSRSEAGYLVHAVPLLRQFIAENHLAGRSGVLLPYARVGTSWDDAVNATNAVFSQMGVTLAGLHQATNPVQAIEDAAVVVVPGGNTFSLLSHARKLGILPVIESRVRAGTPYIGWSAGANLASPTIMTTNDMPVVDPGGFDALDLFPFQINPHYTDAHPPGFSGETRRQRIAEFCAVNPTKPVLGMPEGTSLRVRDSAIELIGEGALLFESGQAEPRLVPPGPLERFW